MGRAFTAVANDASAIYWNPAGLARINRWQGTCMYNNLYLDTEYGFLGGICPLQKNGSLGLGIIYLHDKDFEGRDRFNQHTHTFSNNEVGFYMFNQIT